MLGLGDIGIFLAYVLCILSAIGCVVYGAFNWNKGFDSLDIEKEKVTNWEQKEQTIRENLDI